MLNLEPGNQYPLNDNLLHGVTGSIAEFFLQGIELGKDGCF